MTFVDEILYHGLSAAPPASDPTTHEPMQKPAPKFDENQVRPAPHYISIERSLGAAISAGTLAKGTILTEGPVAELFGTSRTPVRTAFTHLLDSGLIQRFDGRGFVVGGEGHVTPARVKLTPAMLGLDPNERAEPKPASAELIESSFEASLASALPFGLYRINEQAAADHYGVSRNIVRDLLGRFQDRGLVRKDLRSHWVVGPLTARDVAHFFSIRARLEPLALLDSASRTPPQEIERMRAALDEVHQSGIGLNADTFEALEHDMHTVLLARCRNAHLLRMIRQTQVALVVNGVFARQIGAHPFEIALREHAIVLDFLARGSHHAAAQCLEEHIQLAAERTRQRLISISVFPEPELPRYLQKRAH